MNKNQTLIISCKTGEALQAALKHRDEYTQNHCERVSYIAIETGKQLGFDHDLLAELEIAALFHDIGKIGIPDEILLSPNKLTEQQFELMKTHVDVGASIVEKLDLPHAQKIAEIIRHHHENYDGSGYPIGLKGEEIPLASRIIKVIDVFDALSSRRIYRNATSPHKTLSIMSKQMSHEFDPIVFDAIYQVVMASEDLISEL
ncbi:MAG: HD-GYP domain-containing protein [Gammaproteobacteria bacterium]|nr:HD-GYP domain-containing protein [Gammaproteobacteria bacterium]